MLPRLSGLEVLARLNEDEQLKDVPVLVITAWNETREDVLAAGADEFVSKPFDPEESAERGEEAGGRMKRPRSISLRDRMLVASMLLAATRRRSLRRADLRGFGRAERRRRQETHSKNVTTARARAARSSSRDRDRSPRLRAHGQQRLSQALLPRRCTTSMARARISGRSLPTSRAAAPGRRARSTSIESTSLISRTRSSRFLEPRGSQARRERHGSAKADRTIQRNFAKFLDSRERRSP